ncbi:hypothetical protein E2C01_080304 [Portunus trituberculatus]|uniref:Uncharacterized protein n=1 Tax=Portunus trituberculatus TaxID=210409 RepID=A0A5B7IZ78_PORTR|nr:hypothetical protein [Portunus trituberculatus]
MEAAENARQVNTGGEVRIQGPPLTITAPSRLPVTLRPVHHKPPSIMKEQRRQLECYDKESFLPDEAVAWLPRPASLRGRLFMHTHTHHARQECLVTQHKGRTL